MSGRGWRGARGGRPWRPPGPPGPLGFRPPPMFRGGFPPRPPAFFPGAPPPWRGGPRGRGRGFPPRGGINKRFQRGGGANNQNRNQNKNRKRDAPGKRLSEEEIGVTEYISDHEGFNGVIKSRYADFQVSEINLAGEVCELTSLEVPAPPVMEDAKEDEELLSKYNLELLPLETWDKINSLAVSTEPLTERIEVDVTGKSKEERTQIHDAVKKAFGDSIVGSTVTITAGDTDKKLCRFEKYRKGVRIDNRVKWVWSGEYVHFVVHKENCDTMDAAMKLAERLMMPNARPSTLGYAGTKDRRAKTSQWFSIKRVEPKRIAQAGKSLRELNVGNFTFSNTHLKLGMLKGNRFKIALRNVTASEEVVELACTNLRDRGFVNYYGLQRFGTRVDTPTYKIGTLLLQGNFQQAIDEILAPREGNLFTALKSYKDTRDAAAACNLLKRYAHKTLEGRLLRALARSPNDLVGALGSLARNTRLLYVHSYQSLVWNRCASLRLKTLGHEVVPGDLVLLHPDDTELAEVLEEGMEEEPETETASEEETPTDCAADGATDKDAAPQADGASETESTAEEKKKVPTKVLTEEDIASGRYTIYDVVLPLPGFMVDYPPNLKDYYEELLTKDGLTLELRHKIKNYSMSGAYRPLLVRPTDVEWSRVRYDEPQADLILSDIDKVNKKELSGVLPEGKYGALLLTLSLPASSYATMALRELLRTDTSGDAQARLNNYHEADKQEQKTQDGASEGVKEETPVENGEVEVQQNGNGTAEKRKLEEGEGEEDDSKRAKTEATD